MKRSTRKLLAILMVVVIVFSTANLNVIAAENIASGEMQSKELSTNISDTTKDIVDETSHQKEWDGTVTESVYKAENYNVIFLLTGHWKGGFNANVKIENTGDTVIENWYLGFDFQNLISNIWNAEIFQKETGEYIIKNAGFNQYIGVGESIQFGFSGNENFLGFPEKYEILGEKTLLMKIIIVSNIVWLMSGMVVSQEKYL